MRNYTDRITKETKLNWSTYATPAEGLSGKFIIQDKDKYGIIKGVTDKNYYTNSYHIPVGFPISIKDKICIEAPYHKLCNAGHISYIGINFHIRYCRDCGTYLPGENNCPNCNFRNIQGISRVTGYLSLDESFGVGKVFERADRISHTSNKPVY